MPTKKIIMQKIAKPSEPYKLVIKKLKGNVINDAQVPGAFGNQPIPPKVARNTAGFLRDSCALNISIG